MFSGLGSCCPDIFELPWESNFHQKKSGKKTGTVHNDNPIPLSCSASKNPM